MSTNRSESGAVAIVGVGAILPDAPDATTFWQNLREGRYSISEVTDRWDPDLYYDADPTAPDMTYSKIGGWCRDYDWNPLGWRMPIPPKVSAVMDPAQKWAVAGAREALLDFGYPERPLDKTRTAVIVGNALGGDFHLRSASRILFPEINEELKNAPSFKSLPADVRGAVLEELVAGVRTRIPDITEDTMPGELGNIVSGRVAALFDLKGPNYITDAACASALAAMSAAVEGLRQHDYDAVITGGIDANMSASTFVKFCKIGALSATGSRPYAEGADGFVMGEGAAVFLMKRLEDAERDGDKIYAVLLGMGGSSDGKGKGITAPNPVGQRLAVERGWERAGVAPSAGDMVEGHGTSTKVGDVVEVEAMTEVFKGFGLPVGSVALGSVKSNIGHLKGAAGAAGVLKAALSLYHKELPPSVGFHAPNPNIDFSTSPFAVNTELRPWEKAGSNGGGIRRAGVSAFGFGGTNFHMVMEEYVPGRHRVRNAQIQGAELSPMTGGRRDADPTPAKAPLRGALVIGGTTEEEIADKLREVKTQADGGDAPVLGAPRESELRAPVRLAIDYGDASELAGLAEKALQALEEGDAGRWRALRNKGVYLGWGAPGKVAFLFPGQGSQYVDMLKGLRDAEPVVADTFREADRVMTPILDGPLTGKIFVDSEDAAARAEAEETLKQTAVTQPAVLTVDTALCRLYAAYGIEPDLVMGHSLGEYAALVAAGGIPFGDALTAVAARGDAMTRLSLEDNGLMAAVFGPVDRVQELLEAVDGYVVVANLNSSKECVIGGATKAMEKAMEALVAEKLRVAQLPVSHAFHTHIVEPASEPLVDVLRELGLKAPHTPVVANIDASFYPTGPGAKEKMLGILGKQIGSPVQFVKGLEKLYDAGARVFVEMGPKRALYGLADDVVGGRDGVTVLYTNHPRTGDVVSANRALCGMYAEGLGLGVPDEVVAAPVRQAAAAGSDVGPTPAMPGAAPVGASTTGTAPPAFAGADSTPAALPGDDRYVTLGRMFADFLDKSFETYSGGAAREKEPVRIGFTGASLGLPGEKVFAEDNLERILRGEQFIQPTPEESRQGVLDRRIRRIVKGPNGEARFETISDPADVIRLAGMGGELDLVEEYGFPEDRLAALDRVTRLAIAGGIDALRDAGIPLVMRYKSTTTGSKLPVGWGLPEDMRDDTGVVFGSAFPGYDYLIRIVDEYHEDRSKRESLRELEQVRSNVTDAAAQAELDGRIADLEDRIDEKPYQFDRRFLFQVLSMGHSQFAEYIGARGPNTQVNGACATGMQAVTVARDWIETGRCRRVVVITADDVTTDAMLPWYSAGFLASGAAATDERIEDAALPFDRRRHGLLFGMGSASLVLEDLSVAAERGVVPICELLGSVIANSAFHGSRLDLSHILHVMENLVSQVERRWGVSRYRMAKDMVFVSHETYTPARGGSAGAEVAALRHVFGDHTDSIVVANTKGFTGHPMAVAMEEVLAVKMLETGVIPPVANFKEVDPELGPLNLSQGGSHPVQYALRLGAGFGSQISMSIVRWTPPPDGARRDPADLGFHHRVADQAVWSAWLSRVTGYARPELEVVQRTLRVKDQGVPALEPAPRQATSMGVSPIAAAGVRPAAGAGPGPEKKPELMPSTDATTSAVAEPVPGLDAQIAEVTAALAVAPAVAVAPPMGSVATRVLEIVSEQTGYPTDMLELDLDLEADLGIDTVKQAEMFAAIRAEYDIERDDEVALRDYPTLARAIDFVFEKRPDLEDTAVDSPSVAAVPVRESGRPAPAAAPPAAPDAAHEASPDVSAETPEGDPVAGKVMEIISEQTGYPPDMLELDLDLEADLGIDTVKQAEMFAAIRAAYGIERDESVALRDYPTLADAVAFVYEKRPDLREGPGAGPAVDVEPEDEQRAESEAEPQGELDLMGTTAPDAAASPATEAAGSPAPEAAGAPATVASGSMDAAQAVPRRVPVPRLRPPLDRFPGTGIEIGEGARVIVAPDEGGVARALVGRLTKKGAEVLMVDPSQGTDELVREMEEWRADGPVTGMYWLPAMDPVLPVELADPDDRREAIRRRVKSLHGSMRGLYDVLGEAGTFFVSGVRLGGYHGYDEDGATDVVGGAVAGYTKAFARERPDALVKTVDFEPSGKTAALARVLLNETLRDPGVVEVGYAAGQRWCVGLEEHRVEPDRLPEGESVYLVTGAAGSIVSAIVKDLAEAGGGTYWLLDLAPEPDEDNPDLARVATDPDGLKRDIFERLQTGGNRVTPVQVEREMARLEREVAAVAAIRAIRAAGGEAHYRTLDLRDPEAVGAAVAEIVEGHGRVDVLIHAAGLEISRSIPKKSQEEFDLVFDVKTEGWYNLMAGLGEAPLGAAVVFSSIAGRFGNAGQVDYSAANDLLCKAVSEFRRTRPDTKGVSIDWTAWRDIGMAARGSIPAIMKAAGIDMLSPEAGIPVVRRELGAGTRGEVVIAQALGAMLQEDAERTALDADFVAKTTVDAGPMAGAVRGFTIHDGLVVDTELRPAEQPFLEDHRIAGIPVLPGVMGLEAMAEAARIPFPGRHVTAIEEVSFNAPFKFYRDEPRTVTVHVTYGQDRDDIVADCRLVGSRQLVGHDDPEVTLHFTGRVRLAAEVPENGAPREMPEVASEVVGAPVIYGTYFHGPAYQVLKDAWRVGKLVVGRFAEDLPPNHASPEQPTLALPRLVELAFQTAGLAELAESDRMGLPAALDRLELFQPGVEVGASALVTTTAGGVFDVDVADAQGNIIMAIKGYRTSAVPQQVKVEGFEALKG